MTEAIDNLKILKKFELFELESSYEDGILALHGCCVESKWVYWVINWYCREAFFCKAFSNGKEISEEQLIEILNLSKAK